MGRFRHYRGGGNSPYGWRPAGVRRRPDLIGTIRSAVAESDPLALLLLASTILDIADGPDPGDETLSRDVLIDSFLDTACPETSAVLAVIGELCDDETLRAKIRRTLATRWDWLPPWLSDLDRAMPYAAVEIRQVLGDGDHVVVGVRLADDSEFSVVVYIDHSMGSVARNAFAMAQPINQLIGFLHEKNDGPDTSWKTLDLADAGARISQANELVALAPPVESPTWPDCRPLVAWVARMLPSGGTGYGRLFWPVGAVKDLATYFCTPSFVDEPSLFDDIVWFGTDRRPGEPMPWESEWDRPEPWARPWEDRVWDDRPWDDTPHFPRPMSRKQTLLQSLRIKVGGALALRYLDEQPLPDEAFAWDGVAADLGSLVGPIVESCDRFCDERLDIEYRTACRRFLARVAAAKPAVFRGPTKALAKPETHAAAVCWAIGKANDLFSGDGKQMGIRDMTNYFGLRGSVAGHAQSMLTVAGFRSGYEVTLASPAFLVSAQRRSIMELRDRYEAMEDR
jgi:hypothetical protein